MKVSGFTFVKNAVRYGYPVVESLRSVLPLVDEMIVCAGDSEDETEVLIKSVNDSKIKLVHSVWDKSLTKGGAVLAAETNKALDATCADADWLLYIQADEVLHEKDYALIRQAMEQYKNDTRVDGLLFKYYHFYGSFRYTGDGRSWYTREIRIVRNNKAIRSYRDAQGFRWQNNSKLRVKEIDAHIYHYGWVREPKVMIKKISNFNRLYIPGFDKTPEAQTLQNTAQFDYSGVDTLALFTGTHPAVMQERVAAENWNFERDIEQKKFKNLKHRLLYFLNRQFGWRPFEYRNYIKV
ncbi:MAG TPA: glycosyltransferase family 2 protein [Ferruginibacter sp.]|nr:glycosyltransferase family 2 protein [Ferruginibacter sp.]HMP20167.1 glycosyltransferase family 2 protein [Ferruginibacter sp.]